MAAWLAEFLLHVLLTAVKKQYLNITRNEEFFEFFVAQVSVDILVYSCEDFLVKGQSILPACSVLIHF
jgi:hypothetical protein